jgi:serine protease Do
VPDEAGAANVKPSLPANTQVPSVVSSGPKLGVSAAPVSTEAQGRFNLPDTKGAIVTGVTVGSAAERAGIPVGSLITAIDGQSVADPDDLGRLIREIGVGKEFEITFRHRGQEFRRRTTIGGVAASPGASAQDLTAVPPAQPGVGSRLSSNAFGNGARSQDRVDALEQKIRELEARIARLEAALQQGEQPGSE